MKQVLRFLKIKVLH